MKVIVTGSRNIVSYRMVDQAIYKSGFGDELTDIISEGNQVGRIAELWAFNNRRNAKIFLPQMDELNMGKLDPAAGAKRFHDMVGLADAMIVVYDGVSTDTESIKSIATKKGIPIFVFNVHLSH